MDHDDSQNLTFDKALAAFADAKRAIRQGAREAAILDRDQTPEQFFRLAGFNEAVADGAIVLIHDDDARRVFGWTPGDPRRFHYHGTTVQTSPLARKGTAYALPPLPGDRP